MEVVAAGTCAGWWSGCCRAWVAFVGHDFHGWVARHRQRSAAGYLPGMVIAGVSVAVDDDETPGFVFDADPSTAMDDAGPRAFVEDSAP